MTADQAIVFGVLGAALALFVTGRWRYDVVALLALLAVVLAGIVPEGEAFAGFGHPAVITVAAVLVVSQGLANSGAVDLIARWMSAAGERPALQVPALTGLVSVLSGFMNNVGALALLLPVALRMARKSGTPASVLLMPLAFASLLGGLITLIGTPPNIIIATFRARNGGEAFSMFDFTPVGLGVTVAGVAFISMVGWRLIPQRKGQASLEETFNIEEYVTEVRVPEGSGLVGQWLRQVEQSVEGDVMVVGLVRGERRLPAPSGYELVREDDLLIVRADSEALSSLVDEAGLELAESKDLREALGSDEVSLSEVVVMASSPLVGQTARRAHLRWRYNVNLLAIARQGVRLHERLRDIRIEAGDVLLLQAPAEALTDTLSSLGCLPLAERGLRIGVPRRIALAVGIFGGALAAAAVGLVTVQIAFVAAAVAMILVGLLSVREVYQAIDWPVIVLLGAMIPVGGALETTGGAELVAMRLLDVAEEVPPWLAVAMVMVVAMVLSDVINNAAAAVLMAPIAFSVAEGLEASPDPFLMAVAVGASSAFLTPIGHQSNTLVMGPGGYRFTDYWRMGLPLEVVIVAVSLPLIMLVWPP